MITGQSSLGVERPDAYLLEQHEAAVREALPALGPAFTAAGNLGLTLSEQRRLTWQDVDLLTGSLAVRRTKEWSAA